MMRSLVTAIFTIACGLAFVPQTLALPSGSAVSQNMTPADPDSIGGPRIVVDKTLFDFGDIDNDKTVTHTFIISNPGTEELEILSVYTDCGCTATRYSTEPMAPGATSTIAVSFNPVGRPSGFFSKIIRVKTNASPKPLRLYIKGKIKTN